MRAIPNKTAKSRKDMSSDSICFNSNISCIVNNMKCETFNKIIRENKNAVLSKNLNYSICQIKLTGIELEVFTNNIEEINDNKSSSNSKEESFFIDINNIENSLNEESSSVIININMINNPPESQVHSSSEVPLKNEAIPLKSKNIIPRKRCSKCGSLKISKNQIYCKKCKNEKYNEIIENCDKCKKSHHSERKCRRCYNKFYYRYNKIALQCQCKKPHFAKGYCRFCYYNVYMVSEIADRCSKCDKALHAKGLCKTCYNYLNNKTRRIADKCPCNKPHHGKGYCHTCYQKIFRKKRF